MSKSLLTPFKPQKEVRMHVIDNIPPDFSNKNLVGFSQFLDKLAPLPRYKPEKLDGLRIAKYPLTARYGFHTQDQEMTATLYPKEGVLPYDSKEASPPRNEHLQQLTERLP